MKNKMTKTLIPMILTTLCLVLGASAANAGQNAGVQYENAVSQQQQMNTIQQAAANAGIDLRYATAANQANGLMYYNAVANQQRTNVYGMSATSSANMIYIQLDQSQLIASPDQVFLTSHGKLIQAKDLVRGDALMDARGDALLVQEVTAGTYEGGGHHIVTE